jgi:hypothetical protein
MAKRIRISNALIAAWFVCLSGALAIIAGEFLAGVVGLALFGAGYAVGVIWMDRAHLLPSGELTKARRASLQTMLISAAVIGIVALMLRITDNSLTGAIAAALAAATSILLGVVATWFAVR